MTSTGAHRSVPTPLRRGAAVVAASGGAFSLLAAAAPLSNPADGAEAAPLASSDDAVVVPAARAAAIPASVATMDAGAVLVSSVEPVTPEPDPDVLDAAELVKAVQLVEQQLARLAAEQAQAQEQAARELAEAQKRAQEAEQEKEKKARAATQAPAAPAATGCGIRTAGLGAVKSHVRAAAEFLGCRFGEPAMHGVAGRAGTSDHPSGKAVDFMVDRATGDALAACALRNKEALGITYVIWEQRINHGNGWKAMEDRGNATANHYDHVHISFGSGAGGKPISC